MTNDTLERLKPLFAEARLAFLNDPSYTIELARQGNLLLARQARQAGSTAQSGQSGSEGV